MTQLYDVTEARRRLAVIREVSVLPKVKEYLDRKVAVAIDEAIRFGNSSVELELIGHTDPWFILKVSENLNQLGYSVNVKDKGKHLGRDLSALVISWGEEKQLELFGETD